MVEVFILVRMWGRREYLVEGIINKRFIGLDKFSMFYLQESGFFDLIMLSGGEGGRRLSKKGKISLKVFDLQIIVMSLDFILVCLRKYIGFKQGLGVKFGLYFIKLFYLFCKQND